MSSFSVAGRRPPQRSSVPEGHPKSSSSLIFFPVPHLPASGGRYSLPSISLPTEVPLPCLFHFPLNSCPGLPPILRQSLASPFPCRVYSPSPPGIVPSRVTMTLQSPLILLARLRTPLFPHRSLSRPESPHPGHPAQLHAHNTCLTWIKCCSLKLRHVPAVNSHCKAGMALAPAESLSTFPRCTWVWAMIFMCISQKPHQLRL